MQSGSQRESISRRDLLLQTGLAGSGVWLSSSLARASESPNEKLDIAFIGAGGRGAANLAELSAQNIVALCDVDEGRAAESFDKYPRARRYHDYRKMLADMDKQIDAVVISAPNHIHAPASNMAMKMGKHCYCEKPLTHSVHEARAVAKVAAEQRVATQMGTQIHATENFRRIVELVQSGAIGDVQEVQIRLAKGGTAGDRPGEMPPIPADLDWNLWLGPAPARPYHPTYVPSAWHYWWDFGGGPLGNMGCHYLDLAFWALGLRHPTTVEAAGPPVHAESTPRPLTVRWEFAARGPLPPVTVTWSHGVQRPAFWEKHRLPNWAWGVFVGSKGMLLVDYNQHRLWPDADFADFQRPPASISPSVGHHQEWVDACKSGSGTSCNFDYAGALTETVLLGNVAYRSGKQIHWDSKKFMVTNANEANQYLRRDYRPGWEA